MHFEIITLFPEMFDLFFGTSIIGRAREKGCLTENRIQLRKYALNRYGQVDDAPYGGGAGMVLRPEPAAAALKEARENCRGKKVRTIFFTPQGRVLNQSLVREYGAAYDGAILFCAHYKGLDERICENYMDMQISIGDYIVTGGELPAMIFMDAVVRLQENVLGNNASAEDDSFFGRSLLEHPLYTRPEVFEDKKVPEVLLSGNPKLIDEWQLFESLKRTWLRRPDLIDKNALNGKEKEMLNKIKGEAL